MLSYEGPTFQNLDLTDPILIKGIFKLSQTIDTEEDEEKLCKNYPYNGFNSFRECDEQFVYDEFKNRFNIMPAWAAFDKEETTNLRLEYVYMNSIKEFIVKDVQNM